MKTNSKQRLTAFVTPNLVKRVKVRGALEGLTLSETIEKALEVYAPSIEAGTGQHVHLRFLHSHSIDSIVANTVPKTMKKVPKHTKDLVVPK